MRNKNRIPIILNIFKYNLKACLDFLGNDQFLLTIKLKLKISEIEKEWLNNSDQRLGQLLSNLGLVSKDIEDKIWNIEEDDWLIENNYCNIEDVKFWGVNYYKNGKKRKSTKYKLLKDLDDDHIQNIIKFFEKYNALDQLRKDYLEYFQKRINKLNK